MSALQPPRINTTDPNQQEISGTSISSLRSCTCISNLPPDASDDHFSSASEGGSLSPDNVPITRVERVDDKALHGEVPGTPAYDLRMSDAVPDEIEVVPEGRRSRSATASAPRSRSHSHLSHGPESRPATPGGTPIPKTVVERVDFKPAYGEVEGTSAKEMRMADAEPDEMRKAPVSAGQPLEGR